MKVSLTDNAREDLHRLHNYISQNLQNPIAAQNTVSKIRNIYARLCDNPYIGTPLSTKTERETRLRFLVSGSYVIIYDVCEDQIKVLRILNGKQNKWHMIFGDN